MPLRISLLAVLLACLAATPAAHAATPPRCHTADLSGHLGTIQAGAGQRYGPLVLVNRSTHTCTVRGYVGGQLNGAVGKLATNIVRDHSQPVRTITLRAGRAAVSDIHWTAIPSGTAASCPTPRSLTVTPPDETATLKVTWRGGMVCGAGRIDVRPLRAQTG